MESSGGYSNVSAQEETYKYVWEVMDAVEEYNIQWILDNRILMILIYNELIK